MKSRPLPSDPPAPTLLVFFHNGLAAVCDQFGQQMPQYQDGWHWMTIEALKADGYDWRGVHEVLGSPMRDGPDWWRARVNDPDVPGDR